ncbi:hypothetical protein, partial [Methylobacterium sp. WL103]|uniref:hypothetical protein n=1 Tax=Methylobacterium sp. WL103 TaxID=2603891 RepID=UPI001AEEB4D2
AQDDEAARGAGERVARRADERAQNQHRTQAEPAGGAARLESARLESARLESARLGGARLSAGEVRLSAFMAGTMPSSRSPDKRLMLTHV